LFKNVKVEGLFFYNGDIGITFLRLYPDGRVIVYGKSTAFDESLQTFPWFRVDSDINFLAEGNYLIVDDNRIKIRVVGGYGPIDYRGTIRDEDTLYLNCRCPFTNYVKSEKYLRFSEDNHIIHFEVSGRPLHE